MDSKNKENEDMAEETRYFSAFLQCRCLDSVGVPYAQRIDKCQHLWRVLSDEFCNLSVGHKIELFCMKTVNGDIVNTMK